MYLKKEINMALQNRKKAQGPYLNNHIGPNEGPLLVTDLKGAALMSLESLDMIFDV